MVEEKCSEKTNHGVSLDDQRYQNDETAPFFTTLPVRQAFLGQKYYYQAAAFDIPSGPTNIQSIELPQWLSISAVGDGTFMLEGTPDKLGVFEVVLLAEDELSQSVEQEFSIIVTEQLTNMDERILPVFSCVYPNPVKSVLNIEFSDNPKADAVIEVFNFFGQKVLTKELNSINGKKTQLNMNSLSNGIYIVRLKSGNQSISQRIVKQ